ncbi:hypothetical protein OS493_015658 [Desmophyllum pertusum]|uniref:Uncharacterized protein n=1 Tax=Desmophyllum pertusum TaxID=174260 RepID=A0A9W9YPE7_9CNID|nr:hypothetical protein OS493_015658 [Desmophyllum pertusum]
MATRTPCGRAFPRIGDFINIDISEDMRDVINTELQSGTEAIPMLESKFNMVMKELFETELLSLFELQDPFAIFSEKLKMNLVGSVSEGFSLPECIHLEEDSSLRVAVRDEADFNLVWSSLKLGEAKSCSSAGDLDGEVEFSSEFPGYAIVNLVKNEAITRWIDLSNIAMNCDGSKVEVYLHPSAVTDEFYMSLHLRSVLSNLIMNSLRESDVEKGCERQNNNFEIEGSEEKSQMREQHTSLEFLESCGEVRQGQKILFIVDQGGPAVNVSAFLKEEGGTMFDMALCLPFPYWPNVANDWITRCRPSGWPSLELVSSIVNTGCALVPVSPLGSQTGLEWRISFSLCERKLAQSLSDCQKGCFLIVKGIWRHFLKHPSKKGLQSYHLKTTMFWVCEEVSPNDWRKDKIGVGVLRILQKLYCFLVNLSCPHYLIPENNLFQDIEEDVLMATLQRVTIAIVSRQQIWYDNPSLLSTLPPENSRMHLNKLEDRAFREAIENVFCFCCDLALHEDPQQAADLEKKLAYNVKEALDKCLQSQVSSRSLVTTFFVMFETTLLQQYWASSAAMRRYIGGRMSPRMIAQKKPISWDLIITLCAWLDMFKFGFNLFVHYTNQESIKDLINQDNTEESEATDQDDQDSDDESEDSMEDFSDHVLLNLTRAFMENGEFDLDMDVDDDSKGQVDEEIDN